MASSLMHVARALRPTATSSAVTDVMPSRDDVVDGHPGVEGQRGEDRGLRGGVVALDVGRRVGLRVAQRLGLLDGLVEVEPLGGHLVEHVVGGAVDDAEHAGDAVARERLAHRADDRDRARDGGLEVQVDAGLVGRGVQRRAVLREQRLVGGHDGRTAPRSPAAAGVRAGSMPPITSTTTSARSTSDSASVVSSARSTTASRSASTSRTATPTSSRRRARRGRPGPSPASSAAAPPLCRRRRSRGRRRAGAGGRARARARDGLQSDRAGAPPG